MSPRQREKKEKENPESHRRGKSILVFFKKIRLDLRTGEFAFGDAAGKLRVDQHHAVCSIGTDVEVLGAAACDRQNKNGAKDRGKGCVGDGERRVLDPTGNRRRDRSILVARPARECGVRGFDLERDTRPFVIREIGQ